MMEKTAKRRVQFPGQKKFKGYNSALKGVQDEMEKLHLDGIKTLDQNARRRGGR